MSINISPSFTTKQADFSAGVSQRSYTSYSIPVLSKSLSLSERYAGPIGNELEDAHSKLSQEYLEISRNNGQNKQGDFLAALIRFRSLAEYKLAIDRWELYVGALYTEVEAGNAGFTTRLLDNVRKVLKNLNNHFRQDHLFLEVPDACPGESNDFMFLWKKGEHHLECEIFGDGAVEFFYRNRSTDETWGEDITLESKLTPEIMKKLMLFVNTER